MEQHQTTTRRLTRERTHEPELYDVVMLNDDFTSMDFVVTVLKEIFFMDELKAESVMLNIHRSGKGVAGTFTYDIACSKRSRTLSRAQAEGFPLQVEVEKHSADK